MTGRGQALQLVSGGGDMAARGGQHAPDALLGRTLGGYRLIRVRGSGGMGVVYEAEQISLHRTVALKVLRPDLPHVSSFVERFRREAMASAALRHPGIVQVYDVGEDQGLHFYSMEYVEGRSLAEFLQRNGRLDVPRSTAVIHQIAEALEYARPSGLVHRDIKPSNILLDATGRARLVDMGLAKVRLATGPSLETKSNTVLGTPTYMAPEQAMDPRRVDTRADIYSLGVTWFHALAGGPPFAGDTDLQVIMHHLHTPLPSLEELRPETPAGIVRLIGRMTQKRREDRFQTPGEVCAAIEAAERESQGGDRAVSRLARAGAPTRALQEARPAAAAGGRRLKARLIQAAVVCAVLGLVVYAAVGRPFAGPHPARQEGPQRGQLSTSPPPGPELDNGTALAPTTAGPPRAPAPTIERGPAGTAAPPSAPMTRSPAEPTSPTPEPEPVPGPPEPELNPLPAAPTPAALATAAWSERGIPLLRQHHYAEAEEFLDSLAAEPPLVANPEALKPYRAQVELLESLPDAIRTYAAGLKEGEPVSVGGLTGAFGGFEQDTFTLDFNGNPVRRKVTDLSAEAYVDLIRQAFGAQDARGPLAAALLHLYAPEPELDAAREELSEAETLGADVGAARAVFDTEERAAAQRQADRQAEALYAEAAAAARSNYLWGVRGALTELRARYPDSPVLTDDERRPSVAQLDQQCRDGLPYTRTVGRDEPAQFRTIQEAVDASNINQAVLILDAGVYSEAVQVPTSKLNLTIAASQPERVVLDGGGRTACIATDAQGLQLFGLVFQNAPVGVEFTLPGKLVSRCVFGGSLGVAYSVAYSAPLALERTVFASGLPQDRSEARGCVFSGPWRVEVDRTLTDCIILGDIHSPTGHSRTLTMENCLVLGDAVYYDNGGLLLRNCTLVGSVRGERPNILSLKNTIAGSLISGQSSSTEVRLENCDLWRQGGPLPSFVLASNSIAADPRFVAPQQGDYRLAPNSPCRKGASDGGDIGCRFDDDLNAAVDLAHRYGPSF